MCPAAALMKSLSGKWKPEIFRLATESTLRFSLLQRQLPDANKQSITIALRDLEQEGLLKRIIIREKPLNVEYWITEKGKSLISIFEQLEHIK
jgi:Predicted transcriptional regulators